MEGVSLVPLMQGKDLERDMYAETDYVSRTAKRAIRTHDGWKYIYSIDTGERELYNVKQDPHELINLIDVEPVIANQCEQKIIHRFNIQKSGE